MAAVTRVEDDYRRLEHLQQILKIVILNLILGRKGKIVSNSDLYSNPKLPHAKTIPSAAQRSAAARAPNQGPVFVSRVVSTLAH